MELIHHKVKLDILIMGETNRQVYNSSLLAIKLVLVGKKIRSWPSKAYLSTLFGLF